MYFTSGKPSTFCKLSTKIPNSKVAQPEVGRRANLAMLQIGLISGSQKTSELAILWSVLIKRFPVLFKDAAEKAGSPLLQPISVSAAVELRCLMRMPMFAFRKLCRILTNLGTNILPSEPKMRHEQRKVTSHVNDKDISVKRVPLKHSADEASFDEIPVLSVNNLNEYIEKIYYDLKSAGKLKFGGVFNDDIWLLFGGDKGGATYEISF